MRPLAQNTILALVLALVASGCGDEDPEDRGGSSGLVINEVSAGGVGMDWFEIYNGSGAAIRLDDYQFTDNLETRANISGFPSGASVAVGGHLVVQFDGGFPGFGLKGDEELGMIGPDGDIVDSVDWAEGDSPIGGAYARIPDGTGPFETTASPTPGQENAR
jgi:hypothetical protein